MAVTIRLQCLSMALAVATSPDIVLLQRQQKVNRVHTVEVAKSLQRSDEGGRNKPCQCAVFDSTWQRPSTRLPKCIYVDLGAADGNSYKPFLEGKFGPIENCGTKDNAGDFEAFLVEANPFFDVSLRQLSDTGKGNIHAMASTAAYMCDGHTSFWLDNQTEHNYWGSSMDGKPHEWSLAQIQQQVRTVARKTHRLKKTENENARGGHEVTVPTMNLMKLLYEKTIPGDWVIVKMDIEGAEWDIVPCLANSPVAYLIDQLYVEEHPIGWQLGNTTREEMDRARQTLIDWGVQMPQYWSPTL